MTTYFVTRHIGAIEWLSNAATDISADAKAVSHWTPENTASIVHGDVVVGILPIDMAADICARGGRFVALSIPNIPPELRGKELSAEQMAQCGACLKEYVVTVPTVERSSSADEHDDADLIAGLVARIAIEAAANPHTGGPHFAEWLRELSTAIRRIDRR